MEAIFLLIPLSLVLLGLAVWLYFRMDDSGQFRDLESHGRQLLLDDDSPRGLSSCQSVVASQQSHAEAKHAEPESRKKIVDNR
jgi:cbb3-type cytochrome oxidase maturation protein